ncbi:hypothetical protein FB45DRAFT_927801 [Roridomyces roridus]|uniref:Secreted protein n=1 Tax=Roridomyces roridus TaxID=1738132 RepID=A0AAD7BJC9_9AGAR|nr:hypothetical protein FB45DRAFT_927801 [Roridomyces roridus]
MSPRASLLLVLMLSQSSDSLSCHCMHIRDFGNMAAGLCPITALGRFNPDRGGHLILWELKLIIRFPPASTILVPSSIFNRHPLEYSDRPRRNSTLVHPIHRGCSVSLGVQRDYDGRRVSTHGER